MSMSSRNAVSVTERERRLAARTEQWLVGKVEDYLDKQRFSANPQWPYEFNVKQPSKSELIRDSDTCIAQARAIHSVMGAIPRLPVWREVPFAGGVLWHHAIGDARLRSWRA